LFPVTSRPRFARPYPGPPIYDIPQIQSDSSDAKRDTILPLGFPGF